jgi:hypothetical protein
MFISWHGGIAQLGERVLCKHEVVGSIPSASTTNCWDIDKSGRSAFADAACLDFCLDGNRVYLLRETEYRLVRFSEGFAFVFYLTL